jgi:DNA-binding transcriptional MerR regulator
MRCADCQPRSRKLANDKYRPSQPVPSTISDVERDTGVAKETLRVWERRYDFPQPLRDPNGERVYPIEQVQKLRLVKRLIDLGFRPGKVIQYSTDELQALTGKASGKSPASRRPNCKAISSCARAIRWKRCGASCRRRC